VFRQPYQDALEQAKKDLLAKLEERYRADEAINELKKTIRLLGPLAGANLADIDRWLSLDGVPITQIGFTDAIRRAFDTRSQFSPTQLRDFLLNSGIGSGQVNLLASVHAVIKRLEESGEIEKVGDKAFSNTYAKKRVSGIAQPPKFSDIVPSTKIK
jgi:hypothetical protein